MIDCWLIFSLLKPFVDIIVQTYIHSLRENYLMEAKAGQVWARKQNRITGTMEEPNWKICLTFLRVIYPAFFAVFVLVFWLVGLVHYTKL